LNVSKASEGITAETIAENVQNIFKVSLLNGGLRHIHDDAERGLAAIYLPLLTAGLTCYVCWEPWHRERAQARALSVSNGEHKQK